MSTRSPRRRKGKGQRSPDHGSGSPDCSSTQSSQETASQETATSILPTPSDSLQSVVGGSETPIIGHANALSDASPRLINSPFHVEPLGIPSTSDVAAVSPAPLLHTQPDAVGQSDDFLRQPAPDQDPSFSFDWAHAALWFSESGAGSSLLSNNFDSGPSGWLQVTASPGTPMALRVAKGLLYVS